MGKCILEWDSKRGLSLNTDCLIFLRINDTGDRGWSILPVHYVQGWGSLALAFILLAVNLRESF